MASERIGITIPVSPYLVNSRPASVLEELITEDARRVANELAAQRGLVAGVPHEVARGTREDLSRFHGINLTEHDAEAAALPPETVIVILVADAMPVTQWQGLVDVSFRKASDAR